LHTVLDNNTNQFTMGSKTEDVMKMDDFIKIEKIGEGKATLYSVNMHGFQRVTPDNYCFFLQVFCIVQF